MPPTFARLPRSRFFTERGKTEQWKLYQQLRCQCARYRVNERLRYNASTIQNGRQPHLYIMRYEDQHAGCYKVGRTGNFPKRLKDLNGGHLSSLIYVAKYDDLGHLELLVHDELSPFRVPCQSREWFAVGVEHIDKIINTLRGSMVGG